MVSRLLVGAGVVVGVAVGAGAYVLTTNLLLVGSLALVWGGATALLGYAGREVGGSSGRFDAWLAGQLVVYVAAFFGVNYGLGLAGDLTLALQLLVLGVGTVGWGLGVGWTLAALHRRAPE